MSYAAMRVRCCWSLTCRRSTHFSRSFRISIRIYGRMENNLIVIENGQLNIYLLDNQVVWEVGRMSKEHTPDIPMHATTISRRHGRFQNMDGIWFTWMKTRRMVRSAIGRNYLPGCMGASSPVMVSPGDVFVFGGGEDAVVSPATVWAFFRTRYYDAPWRAMDSRAAANS